MDYRISRFFLWLVLGFCFIPSPLVIAAEQLWLTPQIIIDKNTPMQLLHLQQSSNKQNIAKLPLNEIMVWVAQQLLNQPYSSSLLDLKQPEYLYISLTKTDCMLFIEEVLGVSLLIKQHKLTLPNLIMEIKRVRYHDDNKITYCSRNHYFKDWALSNIHKKIVRDYALQLTQISYPYVASIIGQKIKGHESTTKTNHFADLSCILDREQYINLPQQNLGFIPLDLVPMYLSKIQNGDIIGIVRDQTMDADAIRHLGIAYWDKKHGKLGMINASSRPSSRKVVITPSLVQYLAEFKDSRGIIVLRVK